MNVLDWILIAILGVSVLYGLYKGLVRQIVSILAILLGLIGASRGAKFVIPLLKDLGASQEIAGILSFVLLFIVLYLIIILLGNLIHRLMHTMFLGCANRLGGAVFGFIRGIIVSSIIIIILTLTVSETTPILTQSKVTPYIMTISRVLISLVPENLKHRFIDQEKKLRELWDKKYKPQEMDA